MRAFAGIGLAALLSVAAFGMGRRPQKKEALKMEPIGIAAGDISPSSWKGQHSAANQAAGFTAENEQDWRKLWKEYLNQEAPPLDCAKYFAVAVFAGLRPTGGYGVEFLPTVSDGKALIVPYRIKGPGKSSFVTQAFTNPYAIQVYRKTNLPVKVEERKD